MKSKYLGLVAFIILGAFLSYFDKQSAIIYFSVLPIQFFCVFRAWRTHNVLLFLLMAFLLVSIGFTSVTLYLTRFDRSNVGTSNLGVFDFSLRQFYVIYGYLILLQLAIITIIHNNSGRKTTKLTMDFIREEIQLLTKDKGTYSIFPLMSVSFIFIFISVWMYNQRIGLIGVFADRTLPFHLNGILYYCRRFLFPVIILFLFVKTKNKTAALTISILCALIIGVTGSSKSLNLLILFPIAVYFFFVNKKVYGGIALGASILIYFYITGARVLIFSSNAEAPIMDVFRSANEATLLIFKDASSFSTLANTFFGSFFGIDNSIVGFQYTKIGLSGFCEYFAGKEISEVIPDIVFELYNFDWDGDMSYGINLGFAGRMIIVANRSYLRIIFEAIILSLIFNIQDKSLYRILSKDGSKLLKYLSVALVLGSLLTLIESGTMLPLYFLTIMILLTSRMNNKKITTCV